MSHPLQQSLPIVVGGKEETTYIRPSGRQPTGAAYTSS